MIGIGSTAIVYQGKYKDRDVAVKCFNPGTLKFYTQEVRLLTSFQHEGIIMCHGYGAPPNKPQTPSIVLDCARSTVAKCLKMGAFSPAQIVYLGKQVIAALKYLHEEKNTIHRDLKSSNVLLTEDALVKLSDFGCSKFVESIRTSHSNTHGALYHCSPEALKTNTHCWASDVYSFGIMLYEWVTGVRPYEGLAPGALVHQKMLDQDVILPDTPPRDGIAPLLRSLIENCCRQDPTERPTLDGVLQSLEEISRSLPAEDNKMAQHSLIQRIFNVEVPQPTVPPESPGTLKYLLGGGLGTVSAGGIVCAILGILEKF